MCGDNIKKDEKKHASGICLICEVITLGRRKYNIREKKIHCLRLMFAL